jgi:hypothetical protein
MAGVGEAEGGGVTRLEQRGGVAIAFMAAALWIEPIDSDQPIGFASKIAVQVGVARFNGSRHGLEWPGETQADTARRYA